MQHSNTIPMDDTCTRCCRPKNELNAVSVYNASYRQSRATQTSNYRAYWDSRRQCLRNTRGNRTSTVLPLIKTPKCSCCEPFICNQSELPLPRKSQMQTVTKMSYGEPITATADSMADAISKCDQKSNCKKTDASSLKTAFNGGTDLPSVYVDVTPDCFNPWSVDAQATPPPVFNYVEGQNNYVPFHYMRHCSNWHNGYNACVQKSH